MTRYKNKDNFFLAAEKYIYPSTILFRAIELKLMGEKMHQYAGLRPAVDVGCGDGIAAKMFFGNKKLEYGLDNNPLTVKDAAKLGVYKKVIIADGQRMPLKSGSVKLVFSNCVIEHIFNPEKTLTEVRRVLKKGGFFLFTTPSDKFKDYSVFSARGLKFLNQVYAKWRDRRLEHYNCYSISTWRRKLEKIGFKLIDGYYYLDQKTIEWWDRLFLSYKLMQAVRWVSPRLWQIVYKRFYRERLWQNWQRAGETGKDGAAVCIVAQRL